MMILILGSAFPARSAEPNWEKWIGQVEYGGWLDEFNAMKVIPSKDPKRKRIVYGDIRGRLHILEYQKRGFQKEWTSEELKSSVIDIFLENTEQ